MRWAPAKFRGLRGVWTPCAVQVPITALGLSGAFVIVDEDGTVLGGLPGEVELLPDAISDTTSQSWQSAVKAAQNVLEASVAA